VKNLRLPQRLPQIVVWQLRSKVKVTWWGLGQLQCTQIRKL